MSIVFSLFVTKGISSRENPKRPNGGFDVHIDFDALTAAAERLEPALGLEALTRWISAFNFPDEWHDQFDAARADETGKTALPSELAVIEQPIDDFIEASARLLKMVRARDVRLGLCSDKTESEKEACWQKMQRLAESFDEHIKHAKNEHSATHGVLVMC